MIHAHRSVPPARAGDVIGRSSDFWLIGSDAFPIADKISSLVAYVRPLPVTAAGAVPD